MACVVFADTIDRVTPNRLFVGSVEEFITVHGTGLAGTLSTMVEYSGPVGTRVLEPNAMTETGTQVTSWLPAEFGVTLGHYSITILAIDSPTVTRRIGPAFFDIVDYPIEQPPLINVPEVVLAEAKDPTGSIVSFNVFGLSFVDPAPVIACSHQSGARFPLGTTTVVCSATDSFASTSADFPVVVSDTVGPILVVPASFSTSDPVVTFTVTATDAIDGTLTPVCSPSSGSTFAEGVTKVVCTATDANANTAFGSFNVTLIVLPVLTLPADFSVEATGPETVVTYLATAEGGTITCTPPSGALFPLGTTTVHCTATGPGGTSTGTFAVTVEDNTPPTIHQIVASQTTLWPPNHSMIPITFQVVASDLVSPILISHIESITSNQSDNGEGDGDTTPDWRITGPLAAELRAERSGGSDRIYTITIVTIDGSGNRTTGTVQVRVAQSRRRAA